MQAPPSTAEVGASAAGAAGDHRKFFFRPRDDIDIMEAMLSNPDGRRGYGNVRAGWEDIQRRVQKPVGWRTIRDRYKLLVKRYRAGLTEPRRAGSESEYQERDQLLRQLCGPRPPAGERAAVAAAAAAAAMASAAEAAVAAKSAPEEIAESSLSRAVACVPNVSLIAPNHVSLIAPNHVSSSPSSSPASPASPPSRRLSDLPSARRGDLLDLLRGLESSRREDLEHQWEFRRREQALEDRRVALEESRLVFEKERFREDRDQQSLQQRILLEQSQQILRMMQMMLEVRGGGGGSGGGGGGSAHQSPPATPLPLNSVRSAFSGSGA